MEHRVIALCAVLVLSAGMACAAGSQESPGTEDTVPTLVWHLRWSPPEHEDSVTTALDEMLVEKIGAKLDLNFIEPGDYNERMRLIMAANEQHDLQFTARWANRYDNNVLSGAYIPLGEMLPSYQPLLTSMPEYVWDGVRVDGEVYAVPNYQLMYNHPGIWVNKRLADKYGLDPSGIEFIRELVPYFEAVRDNEENVIPTREGYPDFYDTETWPRVGISNFDPVTYKLVRRTDLEGYRAMREWNLAGFFPADVATLKDDTALIRSERIFSDSTRVKPGGDAEFASRNGFEVYNIPLDVPRTSKNSVQSTLTAISVTSENPEKAMDLIQLAHVDAEFLNLLVFGIEGQDYEFTGESSIDPAEDAWSVPAWMVGNQFLAYTLPGQSPDVWEETERLNREAVPDPFMTFSLDREPIANELNQYNAIMDEYEDILDNGLDDPDKVFAEREERVSDLVPVIMAEVQRQVDEWLQDPTNKKTMDDWAAAYWQKYPYWK